jgi:hypothetical protein
MIGERHDEFQAAWDRYILQGVKWPALGEIQWVRVLLGRSPGDPPENADPDVAENRERRFLEEASSSRLTDARRSAVRSVIWALSRYPQHRPNPAFAAAQSEYLASLRTSADRDLDEIRELVELWSRHPGLRDGCRLTEPLLDHYIESRSSLADAAAGVMPAILASYPDRLAKRGESAWQVAHRRLAEAIGVDADGPRRARGALIQAYADNLNRGNTSAALFDVVEDQLSRYGAECQNYHPFDTSLPSPAMKNREKCDEVALLKSLAILADPRHSSVNGAARARLARLAAAAIVTKKGPAVWTKETLRPFSKLTAVHPDCIPYVLDTLAWRPEFWDETATWGEGGAFADWDVVKKSKRDSTIALLRCFDRLTRLLAGYPRPGDITLDANAKLEMSSKLNQLISEVGEKTRSDSVKSLFSTALGLAAEEADMFLVKTIDDAKAGAATAAEMSSATLAGLTDKSKPLQANPALEDALRARYASLSKSASHAPITTADGMDFYAYERVAVDLRPFKPVAGMDTLGQWRQDALGAFHRLLAAALHIREADREFRGAGFIFGDEDFNRDETIRHIRSARGHYLAARVLIESVLEGPGDAGLRPWGDDPTELLPLAASVRTLQVTAGQDGARARPLLQIWASEMWRESHGQLDRLDARLDASGYRGAIGLANFHGLLKRLQDLKKLQKKSLELESQPLRLEEIREAAAFAARAADARVSARGARVAAAQLELELANLGIQRAKYLEDAEDYAVQSTHFAAGAADKLYDAAKSSHAAESIDFLHANYEQAVLEAQIDMLLAVLPRYIVELDHCRGLLAKTRVFLAEQKDEIARLRKEWKDKHDKPILEMVIKVAVVVANGVSMAYGLPPLGSIAMKSVDAGKSFARGRGMEGLGRTFEAFEMGGGEKLLEKGLTKIAKSTKDKDGKPKKWVQVLLGKGEDLNPDGKGRKKDSLILSIVRTSAQSLIPDKFPDLLKKSPEELAHALISAGTDAKGTAEKAKGALGEAKKNLDLKKLYLGQRLAAGKRLREAAIGMGINAAADLLHQPDKAQTEEEKKRDQEARKHFREMLAKQLGVPDAGNEEVLDKLLKGARHDATAQIQRTLTELYRPFDDLSSSILERANQDLKAAKEAGGTDESIKAELPARERAACFLEYVHREIKKARKEQNESGAPTILSEPIPVDMGNSFDWVAFVSEAIIDGSLEAEEKRDRKLDDAEQEVLRAETMKSALVAIRASIDVAVSQKVTEAFAVEGTAPAIRVNEAFDAEVRKLTEERLRSTQQAKDDAERYIREMERRSKAGEAHDTLAAAAALLRIPPPVTLPPKVQSKLSEFDEAIVKAQQVCAWLLDSTNYKQSIDQAIQAKSDRDYDKKTQDILNNLNGELDKSDEQLVKAIRTLGAPETCKDAIAEPVERLAAASEALIRAQADLAKATDDNRARADADVKAKAQLVEDGRRAAYRAIRDHLKLPDPEKVVNDDEQKGILRARFQEFAGLQDGLFSVLGEMRRQGIANQLNTYQKELEAASKRDASVAAGLVAGQRLYEQKSQEARRHAAEVDRAMAETFAVVAGNHLKEEQDLLHAEQFEYQRARCEWELAMLDAEQYQRLNGESDLYYNPQFRKLVQREVWRTARDAAFFVREYFGLDEIKLPVPKARYWSPTAIEGFVDYLEFVEDKAVYDREHLPDQAVYARFLIDYPALTRYGRKVTVNGTPFWRIRFAVDSQRTLDEQGEQGSKRVKSPYPSPALNFFRRDDVVDWEAVGRAYARDSGRDQQAPKNAIDWPRDVSAQEAAIDWLNSLLEQEVAKLLDDEQSHARRGGALALPRGEAVSRARIEIIRRFFPALAPPVAEVHAWEGETSQRTVLGRVYILVREGSVAPGVELPNLKAALTHRGDGWITTKPMAESEQGKVIQWPPAPTRNIDCPKASPKYFKAIEIAGSSTFKKSLENAAIDFDSEAKLFALYYPLLGTYEVDLPREAPRKPEFWTKEMKVMVILSGSAVQKRR